MNTTGLIEGSDDKDSTSIPSLLPTNEKHVAQPNLTGVNIGIPSELMLKELPTEIKEMWKQTASVLKKAGANVSTNTKSILILNLIFQSGQR